MWLESGWGSIPFSKPRGYKLGPPVERFEQVGTIFSVVYFSRKALPQKRNGKRAAQGDPGLTSHQHHERFNSPPLTSSSRRGSRRLLLGQAVGGGQRGAAPVAVHSHGQNLACWAERSLERRTNQYIMCIYLYIYCSSPSFEDVSNHVRSKPIISGCCWKGGRPGVL